MPTYEYECTKCGLVIEEFKSMSAPRRQRCTKCRGKVQRLISGGSGIHFKGSGFYVTDSKSKTGSTDKTGSSGKTDKKSD
jgi:putative FmdB family regulatory protein